VGLIKAALASSAKMAAAAFSGLALGLLVSVWAYGHGQKVNEGRHAAALAAAQAQNMVKQKALIKGVQKVAEDADLEQTALESRLAGADLAVERLRQAVRDANARADASTTAVADAVRARTLLARCTVKYRDVAKRADQLRANVIGLQAYAVEVSR
jgi:uncharacterized protein HemX